ncbi:MAG: AP endonuc 2 protein [Gammaproteobacteria bacterium]|nr:AP endonuc 2 protein [Gammaproteobacteria bacterium]
MPAETALQLSQAPACYLHRGIDCIELFDYPLTAMTELRELYTGLQRNGYRKLGFHSPMPRTHAFQDDGVACFYLHDDANQRRLSFELLEHTLQHARQWQADYVVTHLTYGRTDTKDFGHERLAAAACQRFAELSRYYEIPINVEFAAYTRAFNQTSQFIDAITRHNELALCIDTGHTMLGANLNERDYFADIRAMAPYTRSMHLWNTTGNGPEHIPLHPTQDPETGWIDIEQTLQIVLAENPDVTIVFEYPVADVTPEIQAGYDWIRQIIDAYPFNK